MMISKGSANGKIRKRKRSKGKEQYRGDWFPFALGLVKNWIIFS